MDVPCCPLHARATLPPISFRFTRPRLAQHLLPAGVVGLALLLPLVPGVPAAWASLVGALPPLALLVGGSWLLHQLLFWTLCPALHYVDRRDRPAFIARHRIQQGARRQPPLSRAFRVLARNQLVFAPLMLVALSLLLVHLRGWSPAATLPGSVQLLGELAGMGVVAVLVFYSSHRFLHRPWWMKRVHRVHHEFRTSCGWASEYAHPVEFCVSNFGTLSLGVLLIAPSLYGVYVFTVVSTLTFVLHHGGYAVPWFPWPVHHDWHHYRFTEAFGTTGLLDRLLGTSRELDALEDGEVVG